MDTLDYTLEYSRVDEVSIQFAENGCTLSFWGYLDDNYKEFKMVFPSLSVAFDMIKELEKCR